MGYIKEILFLMGNKKKFIPYLIFLFIFLSFLDLLGIGLIGPYVSIIIDEKIQENKFSNFLFLLGFSETRDELLIYLGLVLVSLFLLKSILAILVHRFILRFGASMQVQLRTSLMMSYQEMPYAAYLTRNSSEYIYAINNLVGIFQAVVVASFKLVSDLILVSAIILLLAFQDIIALSILLILLVTLIAVYDQIFQRKLKVYGKKSNIAASNLVKSVSEGIQGFKEIRILGREKKFNEKVLTSSKKLALNQTKEGVIASAPRFLLEFLMVSFIVLLVIFTLLTSQRLESIVATLAIFAVAILRLLPSASSISSNIITFRFNRDSVSKLYNDLITFDEIDKNKFNLNNDSNVFKNISLIRVGFSYKNTSKEVLKDISFKINNGDCIGIVGPSGSGKTTLLDLLLGLLECNAGIIEYNNIPLEKSIKEWQSKVAYLPQEVFLLDDTIRHNVALGIDEKSIDNQMVYDSLDKARLLEFVNELSDGIETVLGERGARLSGGQRQRIALARAFYHQRDVLVLDEATSSLDTETEKEIVDEIRYFKGNKTIIVIAHRLSTLQYCDVIYKLDKGTITASGSPEEILKLNKK